MATEPARAEDTDDDIEWEIVELVAEHGSERAALRAVLHDMNVRFADADRAVSRGMFSAGTRAPDAEDEA